MVYTDSNPKPKARLQAALSALYPRAKKIKVSEGDFGRLWIRVRVRIDGSPASACVSGFSVHSVLTHLVSAVEARPELRRALLS